MDIREQLEEGDLLTHEIIQMNEENEERIRKSYETISTAFKEKSLGEAHEALLRVQYFLALQQQFKKRLP